MSKEEKKTYTIKSDENLGEVKIADEVVAIIAGLAAMEVEGVSSMAGNATRELIAKLGMKSLSKGVKVDVLDGIVTVTLALNMSYGYSIKDITAKVQEKVKAAIENMTGLEVADVMGVFENLEMLVRMIDLVAEKREQKRKQTPRQNDVFRCDSPEKRSHIL